MADYRLKQSGDEVQNILDNAAMRAQLTAETERAQQAEQQLQTNINNEAQSRQGADTTLQQHIDAEVQARQQGDAGLNQLIQQVQASLINYYLKTETYSANQIDQMLAAIKQFRYQVVDELPTPSADTMGIIYLVPSAHAVSGNVKDEYITLTRDEGSGIIYYFEQIGETAIDLSNYYTKAQTNAEISAAINAALASYYTKAQTDTAITTAIAQAIANYYTKVQVDALVAPFITKSVNDLVNYYLKSDIYNKTEVQQLIDSVKQFTYVSVAELPTASADTMNKIYLVPSTNPQTKNVKDEFITIAVTDQGTTTYSWEQIGSTEIDLSGYSTTEQMNAAIATAISTALANYYTKSETMSAAQVNTAIEQAITTALASYYTKTQTDAAITAALNAALADYSTTQQMAAAISQALVAYYTKTEVDALIADFITASTQNLLYYYLKSETYSASEVDQLLAAIKQFTYEAVAVLPTASAQTVGKIYLVPNADPQQGNVKDEYITLTTTEESTTTYSWECIGSTTIDLSNYYTKAQTDAAITAALNAALSSYVTSAQMTQALTLALANYYTKGDIDTQMAQKATKTELQAEENRAKGVEEGLDERVGTIEEYIPAISGTLPTVFTLEVNSDPEIAISNQGAAERYIQQMGGYMMLVHNGAVYAAKLDKGNWGKFADGSDVTAEAKSNCEVMIHVPTCNFRAVDKECVFGGLTPVAGGHTFDSPQWVGAYQMGATGHSRPGEGSGHTHTMTEFWNMAQAIGSGFGLANWGFHCLINCVYQARFGDLDSETLLSLGNERSSDNWEAYRDLAHGKADSLADGTGCVAAVDSADITRYVTKLFGFEDLFGKLWEFRPGIRFYMSGSTRIATIYSGNIVSNTASGRNISGVLQSASGQYSTAMELGAYWDMLPKAVGGSATTYYCDGYWASTSGELLIAGGAADSGSQCGLACVISTNAFSRSAAAIGARLAFYGNPEIVSGSELLAMLA